MKNHLMRVIYFKGEGMLRHTFIFLLFFTKSN